MCAARPAGQAWPARVSWPQGPQRLRGQGRPEGPSRQRCAAALRLEGRARTLRGAPGDERRRSRHHGFWSAARCHAARPGSWLASQAAGEIIPIAECLRMVLCSSIQAATQSRQPPVSWRLPWSRSPPRSGARTRASSGTTRSQRCPALSLACPSTGGSPSGHRQCGRNPRCTRCPDLN